MIDFNVFLIKALISLILTCVAYYCDEKYYHDYGRLAAMHVLFCYYFHHSANQNVW